MSQVNSNQNASAAETAQIEIIGSEPFSKTDTKEMPVYRAYGYTGKWSGKTVPPTQGARVKINFNGLGEGEVINYFSEDGWLGIRVRLDKEPAWRKKQSAAGKPAMVFGAEITVI